MFLLGVVGPLSQVAYAVPLDTFEFGFGSNPYIEFENVSGSAISIEQTEKIDFRIQGSTLSGTIGEDIQLINNDTYAVQLINEDTNQPVGIVEGYGNLTRDDLLEVLSLNLKIDPNTLNDETLYRIEFLTPTIRTLINRIAQNIFIDSGEPANNVEFDLREINGNTISSNTDVYDQSHTGTESPSIREFDGSNVLTFEGPTISMDLGDLTDIAPVDMLEFRFEGTHALTVSPGAITASINGGSPVSGSFELLNGGDPYVYGITLTPSGGIDLSSVDLTIEADPAFMSALQPTLMEYVSDNQGSGNAYVLAYDSSQDVIGYNLLLGKQVQLHVAPDFIFTGLQPDFEGYYEQSVAPELAFVYTGIAADDMYINGQTTFNLDDGSGDQVVDFTLKMKEVLNNTGNYIIEGLHFADYTNGQFNDPAADNQKIPVNPFEVNEIVLTRNIDGTDYTESFYWEPDQEVIDNFFNYYGDENVFIKTDKIGPGLTDIMIQTDRYTGSEDDLTFDLYYNATSGSAMTYQVTSGTPILVAPYEIDLQTDTEHPNKDGVGTHWTTLFDFVESDVYTSPYLGFGAIDSDEGYFSIEMKFNNSDLAIGEVAYMPMNGFIDYDQDAPEPWVEGFEGFENGEYKFLVKFGNYQDEYVDLNQFNGKLDEMFGLGYASDDDAFVDPNISVVSIEGIRETHESHLTSSDPYSRAIIGLDGLVPRFTHLMFNGAVDYDGSADLDIEYDASSEELFIFGEQMGEGFIEFHVVDGDGVDHYIEKSFAVSSVDDTAKDIWFEYDEETILRAQDVLPGTVTGTAFDDAVFFVGMQDVYGNSMIETEFSELQIETPIDSYLIDGTGNYLLNAELRLIPLSEVPQPVSGSAIKWDQFVHLMSNDDGRVTGQIYPGTYLAFELAVNDDKGVREEKAVDSVLSFPVRGKDNPYTTDIQLPAHNVQGNSVRAGGTSYDETIIFIDSDYLTALENAMSNHENWELFDVLQTFYIKKVETDKDGNFSAYLRPNDYTLVGKFEGESVIEAIRVNGVAVSAISPFEFTVASSLTTITDVEFPPPTLTGTVVGADSQPVEDVFIELIGDNGMHFATMTDEDGKFNAAVYEEGTYKITVVRTDWELDGEGLLFIDEAGFGSVAITQANIDNIETGSENPVDMGTVTLPAANFQIQFQVDGENVGDGEYSSLKIVQDVPDGQEPLEFHIPTKTGGFKLYLPDADYQIEEFNFGELWENLETPLTFNIPSTVSPYSIPLDAYYNAVIIVEDEGNTPLSGYRVETNNTFNGWWQGSTTNAQGKAYFNYEVPDDGTDIEINVNSYEFKDERYELYNQGLKFNINNSHGGSNAKASFTITVRAPNFTGTLFSDQARSNQIFDGHLDVRQESNDASVHDPWYNIYVDHDGEFAFVLPEIGLYMIESAGAHITTDPSEQWFEIGQRIEVIDVGGSLVVVEPGTQTPITMPMTVGPQPDNFFGNLYKTGTTPYLENVPPEEYYVSMVLRETNIDYDQYLFDWEYLRHVDVDQDGSFSTQLDSSKTYEVIEVNTSRIPYHFSTPFAVTLSETTPNVIVAPVPNFNGKIAGFENTPITNIRYGRVELESQDGTMWIGTDIDDTGNFGLELTDGEIFNIREYWYESEDAPNQFSHHYVRLNREVVIGTNSNQMILAPNFKIDLSGSEDLIVPPVEDYENFYNANVRPLLTQADFINKYPGNANKANEEYERYQFNPWEFSTWVEGKFNDEGDQDPSNDHIEFYTYLETGPYELMDVNGHNLFLDINEEFALSGAQSVNVDYNSSTDSYTLDIEFSTNVTGSIDESGQDVAYAWVNFMRTDLDWNDYSTMRWFGASTNENGEFALNLPIDDETGPAGDDEKPADDDSTAEYRLDGYHTEGQWVENVWKPGKWTPVGFKFMIDDSEAMLDANGQPLAEIEISPNVTGEVYKILKDHDNGNDFFGSPPVGDYAQIKQAWLTIWPYDSTNPDYEIPWHDWEQSIWTQTDPETGRFTLMLDTGEYIVTEASMNNYWFNPETVFEIDSSGNLVDVEGDSVTGGILEVKPEQPNFAGTAYSDQAKTTPLNWGWFMVRPADADEHDWEQSVWINTDSVGNFETKLPDGNWKVSEMGGHDFWEKINIPFTVNGSTVTSDTTGFVANNVISVFPPDPNLQGIVKNKSGTQVFTNAWLTIKPADASEYEWENALWTEYRLQDDNTYRFELNIEPGDYKVTEVGSYDFFYHADINFTVASNGDVTSTALENGQLVVEPPQPNLSGTVFGDTDNDNVDDDPIGNGWLGIARYEDGVQVTMEGEDISDDEYKDEWSNMYWQHTRWTETNENGGYEMNLDTGSYQIIGVGGQGVWYQPRLEFDIEENQVTILDISEPGPNVTITVSGVPDEMLTSSYAWLDVFREVDGNRFFEPVEFLEKDLSDNFIFEGNLTSGTYTIGFFGTDVGGLEIDDETMTVSGTTTHTVNVGIETGQQIVEGQILNNSAALGEKAWIKIEGTVDGSTVTRKTQTDGSGNFKFKLPDNTDWSVTEISIIAGYLLLPDSSEYDFNSGNTTTPSLDWDLDIGSLLE